METVVIGESGVHVVRYGAMLWVLIPLAIIAAGLIFRWFRHKEHQLNAATHESAAQAADSAAKVARLEQRVAVLERILTDRSAVLADEIDRLRDNPLN